MPAESAQEDAWRSQMIETVTAMATPVLLEALTSPDQTWRAEINSIDCTEVAEGETYAYQELRLVSTADEVARIVDSQLIACGGLGAYGLAPRFWSPGAGYFYYTDGAIGAPDGCGYWNPPLLRVDTEDMQVERLGGGVVSPDGTLVAAWSGEKLGIWEVDGERIGLFEVPTVARLPGPIAWRPDSSAIAFLISEGYCPPGETDLARLDLAEMRPVMILASREPAFTDLIWDAPNALTLVDESGNRWSYNLLRRELLQLDR